MIYGDTGVIITGPIEGEKFYSGSMQVLGSWPLNNYGSRRVEFPGPAL